MKLLDFTGALNEELSKLIPEDCSAINRFFAGLALGMLDFKIGQSMTELQAQAADWGVIDAEGNVNMDCVEHMLKAVKWPVKIGPFKFDATDAEKVVKGLRARG